MARPLKTGLDYFPLNTDLSSDPKIKQLIIRCGKDGGLVFLWSMMIIYHEGYFATTDEIVKSITWDFRDIDEQKVKECISAMAEFNLINRNLFCEEGILTSHGIQKQYLESTMRRTRRYGKYRLLSDEELKPYLKPDQNGNIKLIIDNNNSDIADNNTNIAVDNTQIKANQNKTKQIIENQNKSNTDFDDFQSSNFSDLIIDKLKAEGVTISRNTMVWINEAINTYDHRSIEEALNTAISKKKTGDVRNIVGYMKTVLEGWAEGKGSPKWVEEQDRILEEEKLSYMKPGKIHIPIPK